MAGEVTIEDAIGMGQDKIMELAGKSGGSDAAAKFSNLFEDAASVGQEEAVSAKDMVSKFATMFGGGLRHLRH
jgi:hypothetical protein